MEHNGDSPRIKSVELSRTSAQRVGGTFVHNTEGAIVIDAQQQDEAITSMVERPMKVTREMLDRALTAPPRGLLAMVTIDKGR